MEEAAKIMGWIKENKEGGKKTRIKNTKLTPAEEIELIRAFKSLQMFTQFHTQKSQLTVIALKAKMAMNLKNGKYSQGKKPLSIYTKFISGILKVPLKNTYAVF